MGVLVYIMNLWELVYLISICEWVCVSGGGGGEFKGDGGLISWIFFLAHMLTLFSHSIRSVNIYTRSHAHTEIPLQECHPYSSNSNANLSCTLTHTQYVSVFTLVRPSLSLHYYTPSHLYTVHRL